MTIPASADSGAPVTFELEELVLLNNALNEIMNGPGALDNSEFQTRTGSTVEEAKDLLAKLERKIEELSHGPTIHSTRTR